MPNQKMNVCNRPNFDAACALLNAFAPGNTFTVGETYIDFGAGMKWETIICARPCGLAYQVLSPRDWDKLQEAGNPARVARVVSDILISQARLLGLNAEEVSK